MVRADARGLVRPLARGRQHPQPGPRVRRRRAVPGAGRGRAGAFAYVDQADQRVWFCDGPGAAGPGAAAPRPLSRRPPAGEVHNHGGLSATADGDWVLAVREVHGEGSARPVRSVVALSTACRASRARPRCSTGTTSSGRRAPHPDGDRLAVVAWDHPDMPWDASAVLVVPLAASPAPASHAHDASRRPGRAWQVAGGPGGVGRPARLGPRRVVALRLGPDAAGGSPTSHPALSRTTEPEPTLLTGPGGGVPRAGLGARPAHHGRDGRRHARGPDDGVGPRRAGPRSTSAAGTGATPRAAGAAVRLHLRTLRARRRAGAHREHARRRRRTSGSGRPTSGARPLRPHARRRRSAPSGRRGGGALHA